MALTQQQCDALTAKIARRVANLAGSATVAAADKARRLKAEGRSIVDLSGGDPDFRTAPHVTEAGIAALDRGDTHYTPSRGVPALLKAIADKLAAENGLRYDPAKEILALPGGKQAIFIAAQALLDPGDEMIIFTPAWVSYGPCAALAGGRTVAVPMGAETSGAEFKASLAHAVSPRTKLAILNTPNNPTGQVWTREQLQILADAAQTHDFIVLADEIYEKLVYDGSQHISIGRLPGMGERTLTLNGLSKSHAMTGWRLGYVAGPEPLIAQMLKVHQHSTTCATSFVQEAAVAALTGPQDYTDMMVSRYKARRDRLVADLNAIPGIRCYLPQGAFYAFPTIAATGLSAAEFTDRLLGAEGVAVTPGGAFGSAGEGHVRLSYANSDEMLQEGARRIGRFVVALGRAG